jgi:hypothetical protein
MSSQALSTEQLEQVIHSFGRHYGLDPQMHGEDLLADLGRKVDAPIIHTTTGAFTAMAQLALFAGVSLQDNVFGALPKKPHDRRAFRYVTARGKSSGGGIVDSGAAPDTVKPTLVRPDVVTKLEAVHFDMGMIQEELAETEDDGLTWAAFAEYMKKEFAFVLDADATVQNGTLASNNLESIERLIAGYTEILVDDHAGAAYVANDLDIWAQDRDAAASAVDAYVNRGAAVAVAEVDRDFTGAPLMNTLWQNCAPYWDSHNNKVLFSPHDTLEAFNESEGAAARHVAPVWVQMTVNGIKTNPGQGVGFSAMSVRNTPWIPDNNLPSDGIGVILLADLDYIWVDLLKPPTFIDSGTNPNSPIFLGKYAREGANFMKGELYTTRFPVHGKLRGLK